MPKKPDPKATVAPMGPGELPWWQHRAAVRSLARFASALNGRHRFGFAIERSGVNYTDFGRRRVVIDPEVLVDEDPGMHLALTKGAICHEAGHVRFTTPFMGLDSSLVDGKTALLAKVTNILEDERVDRAVADTHWGTAKYFALRKRRMWSDVLEACTPDSDDPAEVLKAILQLRYGWELKGTLSPTNAELLEQVRPLVVAAWNAIDTATVRAYAERVIEILKIAEPTEEQLNAIPQRIICRLSNTGARPEGDAEPGPGGITIEIDGSGDGSGDGGGGDLTDARAKAQVQPMSLTASNAAPGEPSIELIIEGERDEIEKLLGGRKGGNGEREHTALTPSAVDPSDLEAAVRNAQLLARALRRAPTKPRTQTVRSGGRYSFRDRIRNPEFAYRKRDVETRKRTLALGALVDCSGSMNHLMEPVIRSVLATHLAAAEVGVPMGVWAFSDWNPAAVRVLGADGIPGDAIERIGGLAASGGTVLAPALLAAAAELRRVRAERHVLLVIHDGEPSDMDAARAAIASVGRGVEVVGIWLGEAEQGGAVTQMRDLFGSRLVTAPDGDALAVVLSAFLARILRPVAA
jgi:Mg-chelatase subunit ChlD